MSEGERQSINKIKLKKYLWTKPIVFSPVTGKHFNGPTQIALAMKERKKKLWNLLISAGIEFLIYVHI